MASASATPLARQPSFVATDSLLYLVIGMAALLPRVLNLGVFVTIDEVNGWMPRAERFLAALAAGDFGATAQSAHPGITTVWLGSAGILLGRLLQSWGLADTGDFATHLALMQLPVALVNSAGVLIGFWLLRRLFDRPLAFLAALLWACDPFVVGFSRILHVDGLMATWSSLSLLAAAVYWLHGRRTGILLMSGVCAGLALLSKSPAVALVPAIGTMAIFWGRNQADQGRAWRRELVALTLWGVAATLTAILLWPALWADPARAFGQLANGVSEEGGEPHQGGNFFLGHSIDVPGPLLYPVALALRLSPLALLGLGMLGWRWRHRPPEQRAALSALAWFALLLLVELSLFPKKFDRYLVPALPAVDILAAAGLLGLMRGRSTGLRNGALAGITALALANVAWWHPYGLIAANQLLGGAPTAAANLRMGWGEGMQQVADWLNRQPDSGEVGIASTSVATLRPYLRPGAGAELVPRATELPANTGYVVVYLRSLQDGILDPPLDRIVATERPVHVVTLQGVEYARIYAISPSPAHELRATFGAAIELRGYDVPAAAPDVLSIDLFWRTSQTPDLATLFVHLLGTSGQRVAQADLPVTTGWESGRTYHTQLALPLPPNLPAGSYRLVLGLYDPQSGQRLPLVAETPADPATAGPDALLLTTVTRP